MKCALAVSFERALFMEEQARTLVKEAKCVINNRPLTYCGDGRDDEVLSCHISYAVGPFTCCQPQHQKKVQ